MPTVSEPATVEAAAEASRESLGAAGRPSRSSGRAETSCSRTRRLDRVIEHEAGDLTATVEAGILLSALNARLAARGPDAGARPARRPDDRRVPRRQPLRAAAAPLRRATRPRSRVPRRSRRRHGGERRRQGRQERGRVRPRQAVLRIAGAVRAPRPSQPPAASRSRSRRGRSPSGRRSGRRVPAVPARPLLRARPERRRSAVARARGSLLALMFEGSERAVVGSVRARRETGRRRGGGGRGLGGRPGPARGRASGRLSFPPRGLVQTLAGSPRPSIRPAAGIRVHPGIRCPPQGGGRSAVALAERVRAAFDPGGRPGLMDKALVSECVHCGFCLPTCPTYVLWNEEMDSPRGRIYLMEALIDGTIRLSPTVIGPLRPLPRLYGVRDRLPSGVKYDRLIELTRAHVEKKQFGARAASGSCARWCSSVSPIRGGCALRSPWSRSGRPPAGSVVAGAVARDRAAVAFRGAPAAATPASGERVRQGRPPDGLCAARRLRRRQRRDGARARSRRVRGDRPRRQRCCGALAVHAGRLEEGLERARRLIEVFEQADVELVVTNAAGCGSNLKDYVHLLADDPRYAERAAEFSAKVRDVSEVLATGGSGAARHPLPMTRRVPGLLPPPARSARAHGSPDECSRGYRGSSSPSRPEQELCCGSAGIYNMVQPEAARELGERKAANVQA